MSNKSLVDAKYECIYSLKFVNDTIEMTQGPEDRLTYLIGDDFTYGGYSDLRLQYLTLINSPTMTTKRMSEMIREEINTGAPFQRFWGSDLMTSILYKDNKLKKISVIDYISVHYFFYEESMTPQNWTIKDDTITIAGYPCQKAICDYRGRSFEAWFTSEIPINEGPWKFYGLPGLIVKLHDTKRHYEFELIGFKKTDEKIDIQPLSTKTIKRTPTSTSTIKLTKIERKEFLRTKFGERGHLIMQTDMAQVGLPAGERVERKYGYIEMDY